MPDHRVRLRSPAYGWINPSRVHVVITPTGYKVLRGRHEIDTCPDFTTAIDTAMRAATDHHLATDPWDLVDTTHPMEVP